MSPMPWPLIPRRDPYRGVTAPPVRLYERPAVRIVPRPQVPPPPPPLGLPTERAEHAHLHPWLPGEDAVMARLATLTDQHGPWTAALRLFTDEPKETD